MDKLRRFLNNWSPYALSLLRIIVAALFLEHGTQKLFGFPGGGRPLNTLGEKELCPGAKALDKLNASLR